MAKILDMSKVAERDTVEMPGGIEREILKNTDLGAYEFARLSALQREANQLQEKLAKGKETPAKKAAVMRVLGEMIKFLIPTITPAELKLLSRANREQIIFVWIGRNTAQREGGGEGNAPSRRTGAASSRGSRRSTAATRKRGSTSRRTS
jgi:hypothetical protein